MKTLISDEYKRLNAKMHAARPYGQSSYKWAEDVAMVAKEFNTRIILDYGSGRGTLRKPLLAWLSTKRLRIRKIDYHEYDPAMPGRDELPAPAELVVCTDVLEHVEPEFLDNVLEHLFSLVIRVGFIVINTHPANKILPDGRNTHQIIEDPHWWMKRVEAQLKKTLKVRHMPVPEERAHKEFAFLVINQEKNT